MTTPDQPDALDRVDQELHVLRFATSAVAFIEKPSDELMSGLYYLLDGVHTRIAAATNDLVPREAVENILTNGQ